MDPRFDEIATDPWNQVFQVVFFPDRIYHAQYLNATRSPRYRYNVREVRGKADINVLKGEVYLDGIRLCNFIRLEYRASRLVETARERNRLLGSSVLAELRIAPQTGPAAQARVRLGYCPWINAYQVECWETLEPPHGKRHDYQVLDLMGAGGQITRVPQFAPALKDVRSIKWVNVSFRENDLTEPTGFSVSDAQASWDNYYERNIQVPNSPEPSNNAANTVKESSYGINFQRGWFVRKVGDMAPVRYRNAMMNEGAPGGGPNNIVEMRWVLQQEFGGTVVFFHEVTVPPGVVEGTHQHIGSEELYYVVEGRGVAYMGENDDPQLQGEPLVVRDIFGIGPKACRKVEVEPGSVIFTKSGGIHGIENPNSTPLRFVAFLYHSA